MMRSAVIALLLGTATQLLARQPDAAAAAAEPTARQILERAIDVAGGEAWLNPKTLLLEGEATFYAPDSPMPRSIAEDYRMWRAMNPDRTVSHGADGKVRITARSAGRLLFEVGFDGTDTWTERGLMPRAEADAYWASNFGFGIIRSALKEGFRLERAPDGETGGHPLHMIRLIDPKGQQTLFGVDKASHYIRLMGFTTPRGWHVRTYDDFVRLKDPDWLQAREVTLYYNGVKANSVRWHRARVNAPIPDDLFAWPGRAQREEAAE
jgi:hypothetical protein